MWKSSKMDVSLLIVTHCCDICCLGLIQSLLKALSLLLSSLFSPSFFSIFCHIVISNLVFLSHYDGICSPITSLDDGKGIIPISAIAPFCLFSCRHSGKVRDDRARACLLLLSSSSSFPRIRSEHDGFVFLLQINTIH